MKLKEIRLAHKLTAKQLGKMIGKHESTITLYESGERKPSYDVLLALAEALDCSVSDLVGDAELEDLGFSSQEREVIQKYRSLDGIGKRAVNAVLDIEAERNSAVVEVEKTKVIPLFPAAAGAGEPVDGAAFDSWEVPENSKAQFAVRISGDSMMPVLQDGEIVLCERRRPQIGELAVIMVNGFLLVKQYIADNFGNIYLRSINRERKDLDYDILASGNDTAVGYGTVIHDKVELVQQ